MSKSKTPDILQKIIDRKKIEIDEAQKIEPFDKVMELAYKDRNKLDFFGALKDKVDSGQNAIIAEIKKASPSKGVLRENFNPVEIAKSYEKNGATCLSILTDKDFFQGDNQYLADVRVAVDIPLLRKEFIISPYQVFEARVLGANCILLIAACLSDREMEDLCMYAISVSMDVLVEVHNHEELERVLKLNLPMIGINNRNLKTFEVSLETTKELLKNINEDTLVITESGILRPEDVEYMNSKGVHAFLIGEAFMKEEDPGIALKNFFG